MDEEDDEEEAEEEDGMKEEGRRMQQEQQKPHNTMWGNRLIFSTKARLLSLVQVATSNHIETEAPSAVSTSILSGTSLA